MKLLICRFLAHVSRHIILLTAISSSLLSSFAFTQINPKQVALLRWYPANVSASIPVVSPEGLVFDGANIWTTGDDGAVRKFRASDGTLLSSTSLSAVGTNLAFDGANVWATLPQAQAIAKIRASDGTLLGTYYSGGGQPIGIAFDGVNIWVISSWDSTVSKIRVDTGAIIATYPSGGDQPWNLVFDGANLWIGNLGLGGGGTLVEMRPTDGTILKTVFSSFPIGLVFDGSSVWVTDGWSSVCKIRVSDGAVLGTYATGSEPYSGVAFDGTNIWIANIADNTLTKLRAVDGLLLGTFPIQSITFSLAFDGANIWVGNYRSNTISKM